MFAIARAISFFSPTPPPSTSTAMSSPSSSPLSSIPSSPLSSVASRSPSPPPSYPSPPSSNLSDTGVASKAKGRKARDDTTDCDGPPPAKRQKITKPKELKTEYLDLSELNDSDSERHHRIEDEKVKKLTEVIRTKRKIVIIAGAGISVSAGIPDFRSATGLFATLRERHKLKSSGKHLFDADVYRSDSSTSAFHDMVRELSQLTRNARPTAFHHMLATLAEEGRLMRLYTQNVDGIDTSLKPLATRTPLNVKGPWPKTIQLHGGLEKMECNKCHEISDFNGALFHGPEPPLCKACEDTDLARSAGGLRRQGVGRLRPRMALYNERNADEDAIGAVSAADLKSKPDAVIVVGTSLKVPGIRRLTKELCSLARDRRGGFTAWINHDPEPTGLDLKDCWDMVVKGDCDAVAAMVGLPRWDDKDCGEYKMVEKNGSLEAGSRPEVVVDFKPFEILKDQGMLTPMDSPKQQSPMPSQVPKLKQQPLSFGSTKIPAGEAPAKKKPGRKPLPSKPTKPKGININNLFTTTKTSGKATRPAKSSKSDDESFAPSIFPNLASEKAPRPLGRPSKQAKSQEIFPGPFSLPSPTTLSDYHSGSKSPSHIAVEIIVPRTPTQTSFEFGKRRETISPRSVPSGMARLLSDSEEEVRAPHGMGHLLS